MRTSPWTAEPTVCPTLTHSYSSLVLVSTACTCSLLPTLAGWWDEVMSAPKRPRSPRFHTCSRGSGQLHFPELFKPVRLRPMTGAARTHTARGCGGTTSEGATRRAKCDESHRSALRWRTPFVCSRSTSTRSVRSAVTSGDLACPVCIEDYTTPWPTPEPTSRAPGANQEGGPGGGCATTRSCRTWGGPERTVLNPQHEPTRPPRPLRPVGHGRCGRCLVRPHHSSRSTGSAASS